MNAPNSPDSQNKPVLKVSPIVQKLQKLTSQKENNYKNIDDGIKKLVQSFNGLIDTLANDIQLDIIDTELGQRLGKDMSEEDADKMLIVYGECSPQELDEWSLAKKRAKVIKLIETFGAEECEEYDLATKTRVASVKNKLVRAVKAEVLDKVSEAVKNKVKDNNKDVEIKRKDLANTDEYQKEIRAIEQAQAEAAIRKTKKKRAAKRNIAINAAAEAGVSAKLDMCVEQTRANILSNFDNAVQLTEASMKEFEKEGKQPSEHAEEIREEVLETIKDNRLYQLSEIKIGSDDVPQNNIVNQAIRQSVGAAGNLPQEAKENV